VLPQTKIRKRISAVATISCKIVEARPKPTLAKSVLPQLTGQPPIPASNLQLSHSFNVVAQCFGHFPGIKTKMKDLDYFCRKL